MLRREANRDVTSWFVPRNSRIVASLTRNHAFINCSRSSLRQVGQVAVPTPPRVSSSRSLTPNSLVSRDSLPSVLRSSARGRESRVQSRSFPLAGLHYHSYRMGSLASKSRSTTIHVTQIQETRLEVQGRRLSPQTRTRQEKSDKTSTTNNTFGVNVTRRSPKKETETMDTSTEGRSDDI